jgi:hypothetical protein
MKQTVNSYQFHDAFKRMERADAFSYEGLEVLFKGLEEFEEDTNEEIELDVIALCCDYCEMSLSEMIDAYKHMIDEEILNDDDTNAVTDWFYNQTWVLGQTNIDTYVFRQF